MSLNEEIEKTKNVTARVERLTSGLTNTQAERLRTIQFKTQVALAKRYGARINDSIVDKITSELILRPDVLCTVAGGLDETPKNANEWARFAEEVTGAEPLAAMNLIYSDAAEKQRIRQKVLDKMDPATKMNMARNGTIDSHLDRVVQTELDARASALDD
jgi:transposase-like protein